MNILFVKPVVGCDLPLPTKETSGSAAFDIRSNENAFVIPAGERKLIKTGFIWEIPSGYKGRIEPRSGHAYKKGIDILAGTIDSDYRGEVGVIILNTGKETFFVEKGDRIAQMSIYIDPPFKIKLADEISETDRGDGGYGSTGAK